MEPNPLHKKSSRLSRKHVSVATFLDVAQVVCIAIIRRVLMKTYTRVSVLYTDSITILDCVIELLLGWNPMRQNRARR